MSTNKSPLTQHEHERQTPAQKSDTGFSVSFQPGTAKTWALCTTWRTRWQRWMQSVGIIRATEPKQAMKQPYVLLAYLGAVRIANALICRTAFLPDEFFQSVEIAHKLVFRYGWQTWEWQPEAALRSPLHALLFVPGYWIVKVSGLEFTDALVRSSAGWYVFMILT